jgi:HK97 family phage major capsid protein
MARYYTKNRTPTTPSDLARCLADPVAAAELMGGSPEEWAAFEQEYATASPMVNKIAQEHAQLMLQQQLQAANGRTVPRGVGEVAGKGRNRYYNRRAPGVAADAVVDGQEFPLGAFFRGIDPRFEAGAAMRLGLQNALSERVPAEGGFLLPEVLRSSIFQLMLESAIIRPRARIVPMDSLRVPYPSIDDQSHSSTVYGGVQALWAEESAALTATAPSFSRIVLEAKKLAFYTTISNEVIQDAGPMLEEWLHAQIPPAISHFEDVAFIGNATNGTGTGQPEGILNSPAMIRVPVTSVNTIRYDDIVKAYSRLWPPSLKSPNLVWLCSPDTKEQLLKLAVTPLSAGTTQSVAPPSWLTGMQAIDAMPSTLFGHPLIVSEKMPSIASGNTTTPGALTLADLDYYVIGERSTLQVAVSEQYLFASDLTAYRFLERLDARSWIRSALSPFNGGNTLSPFVKIDSTATS